MGYQTWFLPKLLRSEQGGMRWLRPLLLTALIFYGLAGIWFSVASLWGTNIYAKDLMQEYVFAKAVLARLDPYLPFDQLAPIFLGSHPWWLFPHPTPHPPPILFLSLPLTMFPYGYATFMWFGFELLCIFLMVVLIIQWFGKKVTIPWVLLGVILTFVSRPIVESVSWGQLNTLILLLLVGLWRSMAANKQVQGGVMLGITIAIKLFAWPFLLYLLLQKNWKSGIAALTSLSVANGIAGWFIGYERVIFYYTDVSRTIFEYYKANMGNLSPWTLGWRMFDGTNSPGLSTFSAQPLFACPFLALFTSIALPVALLVVGLWLAISSKNLNSTFSILVCTSILVSPIVWFHYYAFTIIPLLIGARWVIKKDFPKRQTILLIIIGIILIFPRQVMHLLFQIFGISNNLSTHQTSIAAIIFVCLLLITIITLMFLVYSFQKDDSLSIL